MAETDNGVPLVRHIDGAASDHMLGESCEVCDDPRTDEQEAYWLGVERGLSLARAAIREGRPIPTSEALQ